MQISTETQPTDVAIDSVSWIQSTSVLGVFVLFCMVWLYVCFWYGKLNSGPKAFQVGTVLLYYLPSPNQPVKSLECSIKRLS